MNRRDFLTAGLAAAGAGIALSSCASGQPSPVLPSSAPARPAGRRSVVGLACEALPTVRIAVVGLGWRGGPAVERLLQVDGAAVTAICDLVPAKIAAAQKAIRDAGRPAAFECGAGDPEAWRVLCDRDDVDLLYICTPWDLHVPMAVAAMRAGKHAGVEVPAALTIDDCWQLVDTAEETRRHCMMLENVCYDFFEMATLRMVREGVFGDIVHAECAYIHDLRHLKFDKDNGYEGMWRLDHSVRRNGNLYPTHGLGPVAQCMGINRGDRFDHLVSMSTDQFGLSLFAKENFGADSSEARRRYALGDMNTSLVRTANGRTVMIQHDTTSPRPYSRIHLMSGTRGIVMKYPKRLVALEPDAHDWLEDEKLEQLVERHRHPLEAAIGARAREVGGHGGMDFVMDWRLVHCLRRGLPLDQDVYDAAAWSSICELSERSVGNRSCPVEVPDFTRGAWKTTPPLEIVS